MLKLVKVSPEYGDIFLSAVNEYKNDTAKFGLDSMRQLLKTVEDGKFDEWLEKAHKNDIGIDLPDGWISNTKYWLLDNN
jgi:predicted acetyltransferase